MITGVSEKYLLITDPVGVSIFGRYMRMGNVLFQFSDVSDYNFSLMVHVGGTFTVNFPTAFGGSPYSVMVMPAGSSSNTTIAVVSATATQVVFNITINPANLVFFAIGPA
jgi:hypothetical protein